MGVRRVDERFCDRCGNDILYDPTLGNRNGGRVVIETPIGRYEMDLDSDCMGKLQDFIGDRAPTSYTGGTVKGAEKLYHLPRA